MKASAQDSDTDRPRWLNIRFMQGEFAIPDDAEVGDVFRLQADLRVVAVETGLTYYDSGVTVEITNPRLEEKT